MTKDRGGMRMIWERVRWDIRIERMFELDYKLNDHFTSRYSRLLMHNEKRQAGFFELRELRTR